VGLLAVIRLLPEREDGGLDYLKKLVARSLLALYYLLFGSRNRVLLSSSGEQCRAAAGK
jgi:hypothetical protein